jgi:hypothetical protein
MSFVFILASEFERNDDLKYQTPLFLKHLFSNQAKMRGR